MTVRFISYDSVDFDFVKKIRNDVFEKEQGAIAEQELPRAELLLCQKA